MEVKLVDFNVESETLELSVFVGGDVGTILRTVSRDALGIIMDKISKNELPSDMPTEDRDLLNAIYRQGGLTWADHEINKLEKF